MIDVRKIIIIFIIAVLYTILVNAIIQAVYPQPQYQDCYSKFYPPTTPAKATFVDTTPGGYNLSCPCPKFTDTTTSERENCTANNGTITYERDAYFCPITWQCDTSQVAINACNEQMTARNDQYNFNFFLISALFALIAIAIGLYLPVESDSLNEWIATGFLLGGLITLFWGTGRGWNELGRYIKPVVIALELVLVIYIAYKKLSDNKGDNRKPEKRKRK